MNKIFAIDRIPTWSLPILVHDYMNEQEFFDNNIKSEDLRAIGKIVATLLKLEIL